MNIESKNVFGHTLRLSVCMTSLWLRMCPYQEVLFSSTQQVMLHPLIVANQFYEKYIININIKAKFVSPDPLKDADFLLRAIFP